MIFEFDNNIPIYIQLVEQLKIYIISGKIKPGERLPSVRELALQTKVNPNTMQKALSELERSGLVTAIRTSGRVVTEDERMITETRNKLAGEQIKEFMQKMYELGFKKEDILALLQKEAGGENL